VDYTNKRGRQRSRRRTKARASVQTTQRASMSRRAYGIKGRHLAGPPLP